MEATNGRKLGPITRQQAEQVGLTIDAACGGIRLGLLGLIHERGEACSGDLARDVPGSPALTSVSNQLCLLKRADLVQDERRQRNIFYTLTERGEKIMGAFATLAERRIK